ncbi:MAG: hypothetical protein ABJ051_16920 [Lentilitoribacter sp.]
MLNFGQDRQLGKISAKLIGDIIGRKIFESQSAIEVVFYGNVETAEQADHIGLDVTTKI